MLKRLASVFMIILVLFGAQSFHTGRSVQASVLSEVKYFVKNYYYGDIPLYLDSMKTIKEIENKLDDYSQYLTKEEYRAYLNTLHIQGISLQEVPVPVAYTSGRHVTSEFLFGNTGYIGVERFQVETPQAVIREWEALRRMGARNLIIDFRFNGGGSVESAQAIIGMFRDAPEAYVRHNREQTVKVKAKPSTIKFPDKPYVLVNKYSASASELVAAAVKDQKAGTVVGQKTFGKGSIQSFFELSDEGAMKLTTAHFSGPGGTKIQGLGIMPDEVTSAGKELEFAHTALVRRELSGREYAEFPKVEMQLPVKPFTITFSQDMNFSAPAASNRVELVRMGSAEPIKINVEQEGARSLRIEPMQALAPGAVYALAIHPRFADSEGIYMRKGAYLVLEAVN